MDFIFGDALENTVINSIIRPPRTSYSENVLFPSSFTVNQTVVKHQNNELLNKSNQILKVSLFEPQSHSHQRPIIIYLHGNAGNRLELNSQLKNILSHNISVCVFDFSGCGNSQGKYVTLGVKESDDLEVIYNYLAQKQRFTHFVIWGRSMGAVSALRFCIRNKNTIKVACLILDSAFYSFEKLALDIANKRFGISEWIASFGMDTIRDLLKERLQGIDIFSLELLQEASSLHIPALFAYSKQDSLVKCYHSQQLYQHYKGQKQQLLFQGDHNAQKNNSFYDQILQFISKYTGGQIQSIRNTLSGNENLNITKNNYMGGSTQQIIQSHHSQEQLKRNVSHQNPMIYPVYNQENRTNARSQIIYPQQGKSVVSPLGKQICQPMTSTKMPNMLQTNSNFPPQTSSVMHQNTAMLTQNNFMKQTNSTIMALNVNLQHAQSSQVIYQPQNIRAMASPLKPSNRQERMNYQQQFLQTHYDSGVFYHQQ